VHPLRVQLVPCLWRKIKVKSICSFTRKYPFKFFVSGKILAEDGSVEAISATGKLQERM